MKTAIETLAKQLFTSNELQTSSVTGFQCNKYYEIRPGLSPSRRSLLESELIKSFVSCFLCRLGTVAFLIFFLSYLFIIYFLEGGRLLVERISLQILKIKGLAQVVSVLA